MTKPPFRAEPAQLAAWRDKSSVMLLTGGAGGGKSRLAGEKLHAFLLKYPNATGLMLRKAREYCMKSIVPMLESSVMNHDPRIKIHRSDSFFEYPNGSILFWGGMRDGAQRESIRSIGKNGALDIAWLEEANAFSEDDFNEILARMRGRAADWVQVILSTNPDSPSHWIYQRLILKGQASIHYSFARDNSHQPEHYARTLASLTGVLGERLHLGLWKQAEGAVYDEYRADLHLIDPFEIPTDWARYRSIDFGFTNPFTCQWWAEAPDGELYLYRETYHTRRRVDQHAAQINTLSGAEYYQYTLADHDAEDRATLEHHGIPTRAAVKELSPGIQAVKTRLAQKRLFIMRAALVEEDQELKKAGKPTCAADEITAYSWPKSRDGRLIREQPVKENDHAMDALRYLVYMHDRGTGLKRGYHGRA